MQLANNSKFSAAFSSLLIMGLILIISIIGPFASDVYLPSLPAMTDSLRMTEALAQLTVTAYLFSFGLFQLIYGPLSDRVGRRNILLLGLAIAILASMMCALANNAIELLIARFLQGAGIAATAAVCRAMMRDAFSGIKLIKVNSYISIIFTIAPAAAPFLGSYLQYWFDWRAAFIFLIIYLSITAILMWFLLPETNQNLNPKAMKPQIMFDNYSKLLTDKTFMGYLFCSGLTYAGTISYAAMSPFLFQTTLGLSVIQYGWVILYISLSIIVSRALNAWFVNIFPVNKVMLIGLLTMLTAGIFTLFLDLFHIVTLTTVIIPIIFYLLGSGLVIPNASASALQPFTDTVGYASALYGCLQLLFPFICTTIIELFPNEDIIMMGIIFTTLAIVTLLIFQQWILRKEIEPIEA